MTEKGQLATLVFAVIATAVCGYVGVTVLIHVVYHTYSIHYCYTVVDWEGTWCKVPPSCMVALLECCLCR